jgi:hypothetical protein
VREASAALHITLMGRAWVVSKVYVENCLNYAAATNVCFFIMVHLMASVSKKFSYCKQTKKGENEKYKISL